MDRPLPDMFSVSLIHKDSATLLLIQHMLLRVRLVSEELGRAKEERRRENRFPIH